MRNQRNEALRKLEKIVDEAVDSGATSITIEYAKEGGLDVCFMFGNTGVGGILVDRALESEVLNLIHERAGLKDKSRGLVHWTSEGKQLEIIVEEYDNFGEVAYRLKLKKGKRITIAPRGHHNALCSPKTLAQE